VVGQLGHSVLASRTGTTIIAPSSNPPLIMIAALHDLQHLIVALAGDAIDEAVLAT
jgi:hypothetical protein